MYNVKNAHPAVSMVPLNEKQVMIEDDCKWIKIKYPNGINDNRIKITNNE